jgi:putative peptide zinc metalloprotease protein
MAPDRFDLLLPHGERVPLKDVLTIGRGPDNAVRLPDPSVSRRHARISLGRDGPRVEDVGSSSGTWVDGARLERQLPVGDGARIRLGNSELVVERRRADAEAGYTAIVPVGASAALPSVAAGSADPASTRFGERPRLRSGYALKRLDASEGARRWVLKDLRGGGFTRLSDADAALIPLIDGQRPLAELVRSAEGVAGPDGAMRLAGLLADLSDRGLLAGAAEGVREEPRPTGWRRLATPRQWTWGGAGTLFERVYRAGGWILFTRPALTGLGALAVAGVLAFAYLVAGRYGTPFVVAKKVGLGGLVFLLGRLAVAAVHESAHGLTMASFGRRVGTAGLKLVLIFPYVFVDTSDAWFEPRLRRIAVSAAGPASDFSLGGVFSLCALGLPAGTLRDIFFQLAFAAYVGALFNLNPFLQRDGYHILVDVLRQPQLRARANEQLKRRLTGGAREVESPLLARYSAFRVAWLALAALFAVAMSLHYEARFSSLVPGPVVWVVMGVLWVAFFVPVVFAVWPFLVARARVRGA